jgi:MFS family permease
MTETRTAPPSRRRRTGAAPRPRPSAHHLVAVLASAGIVVSLMQSIIIPLVPELPTLLHATSSDTSWAVTVTLLAAAVATPTVGRLGDMVGKRRMLLISLGMLIAGSVLGALSTSLVPLIVARALQGLAAGVVPLGISIMRDEVPEDRLGTATATMSSSLGVGGALGLPVAALIAEAFDWHVLFWVAAALGTVSLLLVARSVPESPVRSGGRFDLLGAIGISVVLVCLLLAISKGADWGWTSAPTLALVATAVVALAAWSVWELRAPQPLVDLRVSARRQVLLTNVTSAVFGFAMFAMSLVLPQILQLPTASGFGLGQSMLTVGLVMAPSGLVMMAVAPVSARISAAAGPKVSLITGAVVVAGGYLLGTAMMAAPWQLVVVSSVIGAGIGLAYGAMPSLVMAAVPTGETSAANSLNTLMRSIGSSVSSAVAGLVLAHLTMDLAGQTIPSRDALRLLLLLAAAAALVAATIGSFLPRRSSSPTGPTGTGR